MTLHWQRHYTFWIGINQLILKHWICGGKASSCFEPPRRLITRVIKCTVTGNYRHCSCMDIRRTRCTLCFIGDESWMRLMRYTYTIAHVPGKDLTIADTLSLALASSPNIVDGQFVSDTNVYVYRVFQQHRSA